MSYQIVYGGAPAVEHRISRGRRYIRTMTALAMMLFALAVGQFWPQGKEMLQEFFLPGEPTVTEQAFSGLVNDLSQGIKLEDAMAAFCQQIIDHGAGELD